MNSRGSVNEIVNFSSDLATLTQLNVKEPLLSFPFDHLYACHSESGDQSQSLDLDKEVEISTHCVVAEDSLATRRLASLESQNKKLKNLLLYHLDLIQQQNDFMSKREKVFQAIKQENDTLKSKVSQAERIYPGPRQMHFPMHGPSAMTSVSMHSNVPSTSSQNYYDTFNDILMPRGSSSQYNAYNTDLSASRYTGDVFDLARSADTDLANYLSSDLGIPSILEGTTLQSPTLQCDPYTMVESKRPVKKEKPVETIKEPRYTVTTNFGTQKIQSTRKRPSRVGSLSRMPKAIKPEASIPSDIYGLNDTFSADKKAKMNTHDNSQPAKVKLPYSGLSDKLRLMDPTPPGEDPYQLGEAEMRAQSPIPKLMLQKGLVRKRFFTDTGGSETTSTVTSSTSSRRVYDTMSGSNSKSSARAKPSDCYGMVSLRARSRKPPPEIEEEEPEVDVVKTDSDPDWCVFPATTRTQTSLCDFSYGETSANLLRNPLDISKLSFNEIFEPSPVNADSSSAIESESAPDKNANEKTKKRGARTTSIAGQIMEDEITDKKPAADNKRGRKRALSTTGSLKRESKNKAPAKPRARRAIRGKTTPVPGMSTQKHYHTCMGDPDLSWYLGLDPDVKKEDCEVTDNTASNVEVPRWREKPYSPLYSLEGTENLDDKVFEKRHQKLEAEERRQLRWHMRRIREQRHVERLRQRQRDPWGPSSSQSHAPADFTVWPQPVRDLECVEITDTLPVVAFGEEIPDLPEKFYVLPWVRSSKAQKRSKRSKTLH